MARLGILLEDHRTINTPGSLRRTARRTVSGARIASLCAVLLAGMAGTARSDKTVFVLNPWEGTPGVTPSIRPGGGADVAMTASTDFCGWFMRRFAASPGTVTIVNGAQPYGAAGIGSWTPIALDSVLATQDTVWILPTPRPQGRPVLLKAYTGITGSCPQPIIAATIRDFQMSHPDMEDSDCGEVVPGMVERTLGPDGKPVSTKSGKCASDNLDAHWFRDVPGINWSTCRDIVLARNAESGNYEFDDQSYFPLDNFTATADGTKNLGFEPQRRQDDHNYHFCLESHSVFDYKPGQRFDFRGDDDVWVFIDGKLAVDLGGTHNAAVGAVDLDDLGLKPDSTYRFDFFFCERKLVASSMKITTSLNLRPPTRFIIEETKLTATKRGYSLYLEQQIGQGCKARTARFPTTGRVFVTGPGLATPAEVAPGTTAFGGIWFDPERDSATFDTLALAGLGSGQYKLRIVPDGDPSQVKEVPFTVTKPVVLVKPSARFVATPPVAIPIGGIFPVEVASYVGTKRDTGKVVFRLDSIPGLLFFLDSTARIPLSDTLHATRGQARKIWVRGTTPGQYTLRLYDPDTASAIDTYPGIVVLGKVLRFTDSEGRPLVPVPAIDKEIGNGQWVHFALFSGDSLCVTCSDSVVLAASDPDIAFLSDPEGAPRSRTRLQRGRAMIYVHGAGVADGSFIATPADGAEARWSPVRFRALPPDSAAMYDIDGDGRADRAIIHLRYPWDPAAKLHLGWPSYASSREIQAVEISKIDPTTIQIDFATPFAADATEGDKGMLGRLSFDGTDEAYANFPVADRVAPVPMQARVSFGRNGTPDTLRVTASERLRPDLTAIEILAIAGSWGQRNAHELRHSLVGDRELVLFFDPNDLGALPQPGDSVRFLPNSGNGVADTLRNTPPARAKAVPVSGAQRPPLYGEYHDVDGDGRIDLARFVFRTAVKGGMPTFDLFLPDVESFEGLTSVPTDDPAVVEVVLPEEWPFGKTSFPAGEWARFGEGIPVEMRDRVPPVAVKADLRLATDTTEFDTLFVRPSERFDAAGKDEPVWVAYLAQARQGAVAKRTFGDSLIVFYLKPGDSANPRKGDSLRLAPAGLQDVATNRATSKAPWVEIEIGPRKGYISYKLPTNGLVLDDGRFDQILNGQPAIQIQAWNRRAAPGGSWSSWNPETGYSNAQTCPAELCNIVLLEINGPARIAIFVYDLLGTYVADAKMTITREQLALLQSDAVGRVILGLAWSHRTQDGKRPADGIYLMRTVVFGDTPDAPLLLNKVIRVGHKNLPSSGADPRMIVR